MKVAEHKGYEIDFTEISGKFSINGIAGSFEIYKDATAKIDRVVKAETKENYLIVAIRSNMKSGKITSYNNEQKEVWFTADEGSRSKERVIDYMGKPNFYQVNENNLKVIKEYLELEKFVRQLTQQQRNLEKQLTDPITFNKEEHG